MAETNPKKASDGQKDVAGRNAASTSAEGETNDKTQFQAREQTAVDSSVSPKSSTLQNPDAEIRGDLTQDVLTANREAMQAEVREGKGSPNGDKLHGLHQAVADAQKAVDAAIRERDAARDAYDREAEAVAVGSARPFGQLVADYHAAADKQAAEEAELRKRQLAR